MFSDNKYIRHKKNIVNYNIPCTNCGLSGHTYKNCIAPVNSYGVIAFRFRDAWDGEVKTAGSIEGQLCAQGTLHMPIVTGMEDCGQVEFLMIRRKDSLRFVEFVRGKYDLTDDKYLRQMLTNMTADEREFLRTTTFEDLWNRVWGTHHTRNYKNDYEASRQRFEDLKTSGKLETILAGTVSKWNTPEWGFPKGRRNPHEADFDCAVREFKEETGLADTDFSIIRNIAPLCETFCGDNSVHYCHKYYLAFCGPNVEPSICHECPHQGREIGDIQWMSMNEAITAIRDENIEKREILLRVSSILKKYALGWR
jgi:8-oxo-dGTP pyrophosphatase MutT (NUDIX family)